MKKTIRIVSAFAAAVTALSLTGCAAAPATPIVQYKDIDNMLAQAQEEQGTAVSQLVGSYETYQSAFSDESFHVSVQIDAQVRIPDVDKMSVYRVRQSPVTQALLDTVRKELTGTAELYDGRSLRGLTKEDLAGDIRIWEEELAMLREMHPQDDQSERERTLQEMKERYRAAPDKPEVTAYPSDGKLHSVSELYGQNSADDYYAWLHELNPNGEVFYGVSDGENGEYLSLSVNNSPERSNYISFRKSFHGYEDTSVLSPKNELDIFHWSGSTLPQDYQSEYMILPEDTVACGRDTAVQTAEDFLRATGLAASFCLTDCTLYTEAVELRHGAGSLGALPCRSYYVVRYSRNVDGATVTEGGDSKYAENWTGDSYSSQSWYQESVVLRINDNGIVGFDYVSPLAVTETVVDTAALKPFSEIRDYFERMIVLANASQQQPVEIAVNRVAFGYTRISEADNFSTGLLVPAWSFYGTNSAVFAFDKQSPDPMMHNLMTINAIDGTVIDHVLGY